MVSAAPLLAAALPAATPTAARDKTATPVPAPVPPPLGSSWHHLPIRALLLWSPAPADVDDFCRFIRDALPKEGVNTLVLLFRYRYRFHSHPELADAQALSSAEVKRIVHACKDAGIKLIPKMNLMAHQSEQTEIGPLLQHYPQFDESPDYNPPNPWTSSGQFGFYSKSLCPRHPDLLPVLFSLMDELIDVCEADAFHVGLDEVWIIAYPKCPRCGGADPAEIFAEYATKLHGHLTARGCRMWMWSDRLIDGKTTNLLAWQASMNNTHRAIDHIPKDIVICDWKYEDAPPTPAYFAVKGFDVLPSSCYNPEAALAQLEQVYLFRKNGARASFSTTLSDRLPGVFATAWISAREFMDAYQAPAGGGAAQRPIAKDTVATFKRLFAEIRKNSATG